jgi:Predicted xylanase/chitin deacetylase
MGLSTGINASSSGSAPVNRDATIAGGVTGSVVPLKRALGTGSTFAKASGHSNLSISGSSIALAAAIAADAVQSIVVREADATRAVEYQVRLTGAPAIPAPVAVRSFGTVTTTKDASTGQTYTAPAGMTDPQWCREALTSDRTKTLIAGATAATYVAQAADENYRLGVQGMVDGVLTFAVAIPDVRPAPIVLMGAQTVAGWTTNGGALADDTVIKYRGNQSVKLTLAGTAGATMTAPATGITDVPVNLGVITSFFRGPTDWVDSLTFTSFDTRIGVGGTYYGQSNKVWNGSAVSADVTGPTGLATSIKNGGWRAHAFNVNEVDTLKDFATPQVIQARAVVGAQNPYNASMNFGGALAKSGGRPSLVLTADDSYNNLDKLHPILEQYQIRLTLFVAPNYVGNATALSYEQMRWMKSTGLYEFQCNGKMDDTTSMISMATVDEAVTSLATGLLGVRQKVISEGLNPNPLALCYPFGSVGNVPPTVAFTNVSKTSGSNIVTVSSTAGLVQGAVLDSVGLPKGTTITQIVDGTTLQLSANATATNTLLGRSTDMSGVFAAAKLVDAIAATGHFKIGRTTSGTVPKSAIFPHRFGLGDLRQSLMIPGTSLSNRANLGTDMCNAMDLMITRGGVMMPYLHIVDDSSSSGLRTLEADMATIAAYAAARRNAGEMDPLFCSHLWSGYGGASPPL